MDKSLLFDTIAEALLKKDKSLFGKYFTNDSCEANISPSEKEEAEKHFAEFNEGSEFDNFESFLRAWKENKTHDVRDENADSIPQSSICSKLSFDPSRREMVSVLGPRTKRNRSTEFDVFEFLRSRHDSGCPIRFQTDVELEGDLEVLMEPQKYTVIDAGLRKIARALTVLNSACSYRLLDVHSERVVR